jgi:ribosomal protein L7/L12
MITAVYAARNLYGCSLAEAKAMLDSLRDNKVPQ